MSILRRMLLRARGVLLFGRLQREMDEEMRAHVELAAERHMGRGLSRPDALAAARREFGNATVLASDARDARGARWAESFVTDIRLAVRGLRRTPLFAAIAVLSIAVGVGATTGIVTLTDALLLQTPPGVGHPDRVVSVGGTRNGKGFDTFSFVTYTDYARASSLSGLAALDLESKPLSLVTASGTEAVRSGAVSANFFSVLDAHPAIGRFFGPGDDDASSPASVVVLTDRYWRARFNADSTVVGRSITLNGEPFTVVGVAAHRFQGPFVLAPDLWIPLRASLRLNGNEEMLTDRQDLWLVAVGRLAPNRSIGQAQAELSSIATRLRAIYPKESDLDGVSVRPLSLVPGDGHRVIAAFMTVLFVVAGLVLIVASTNVSGMLLARAASRQREIAVRIAMGASRARLVRQLATESLVLGLAAGAIGLVLAKWLVAMVMSLVPHLPVQLVVNPTLDARVFGFALGITLVTSVAVGALPAMESTNPDLVPALKLEAGATARRQRVRSVLLVSQIAVSMLLLVIAGLFGRSLVRARAVDPGFATHHIAVVSLDLNLAGYDETRGIAQAQALVTRAKAIPGVSQAAMSAMLPLSGSAMGFGSIVFDGHPAARGQDGWNADWNVVSPGYFDLLGIPLVRGRAFTASDRPGAPTVAILNETFAMRVFGTTDVVGRTFRNGKRTVTVVGVARNAKYRSLDEPPLNFVYVPLTQWYRSQTNLLVRTSTDVNLAGVLRRLVPQFDRRLPVLDQSTMDDQIAFSLFPQRLALWIAGSLGVIALLLAVLGIYGVIAYGVAQRTREIGIRVALGAERHTILGMVLRRGLVLAGVGVLVGAVAAFGATRLISSFLFGVPPTDVLSFTAATILLSSAAVLASWLPARRAAAVDPMIALRSE
jgi:putative ABC transport system permease protein